MFWCSLWTDTIKYLQSSVDNPLQRSSNKARVPLDSRIYTLWTSPSLLLIEMCTKHRLLDLPNTSAFKRCGEWYLISSEKLFYRDMPKTDFNTGSSRMKYSLDCSETDHLNSVLWAQDPAGKSRCIQMGCFIKDLVREGAPTGMREQMRRFTWPCLTGSSKFLKTTQNLVVRLQKRNKNIAVLRS